MKISDIVGWVGTLFFLFLIIANVTGESTKVYVKDHDGDVLHNVDVEILHKGDPVKNGTLTTSDYIEFKEIHPGTYTVLARWERDIDCAATLSLEGIAHCQCQDDYCWQDCPETGEDHIFTDENGLQYTCRYHGVFQGHTTYQKIYHFTVMGITRTHVKLGDTGDDDIARITLEGRESKLWNYANATGHVIESSSGFGDTWVWDASETAVEELVDDYVYSKLLQDTLKNNAGTNLMFSFASSAINPDEGMDEWFNDIMSPEGIAKYGTDLGFGRVLRAVGVKSLLGRIVIPFMVIHIPWSNFEESKRCRFTETDDLDMIMGEGSDSCNVWVPVSMVNYGDPLFNVDVNVQSELHSGLAGSCEKPIVYSPISFDDISLIGISDEVDSQAKSSDCGYPLTGDVRLFYDIVSGCNTCGRCQLLTDFTVDGPVITQVQHPEYIYANEKATITATVRDANPVNMIAIDYPDDPDKDSETIECGSEGGVRYSCEKKVRASQYSGDSLEFKLIAGETVNDNDQQYYKINVVEDAVGNSTQKGILACDGEGCVLWICDPRDKENILGENDD